ncbi:hypothetical protein [Alteribacter aurantiacus]|uniref:hypothetical protein n=1 Tax=Alteribacter aurantiacus TaxID=254410 RepID=UPI000427DBFC|nr:hypothetical protein [Alteribacter aurantiacus]
MKKIILVPIVILFAWISISLLQTPVLYGQTEDQTWTASYTVANSIKNQWEGDLK